jgi:hypothetical protein
MDHMDWHGFFLVLGEHCLKAAVQQSGRDLVGKKPGQAPTLLGRSDRGLVRIAQ